MGKKIKYGLSLQEAAQVFGLMGDETRLRIMILLAHHGEMHVAELCASLAQSQPAVSHHLMLLRMRKLVEFRRAGKFNFYRPSSPLVGDLLNLVCASGVVDCEVNGR